MDQIHKRFSDDQVKNLFKGYCQRLLDRADVENALGIGKARFFALLKDYRQNPENFSIGYQRASPSRLTRSAEKQIEKELRLEKSLIEDRELPISSYNYSAIRDRLRKRGITISLPTIIERAKRLGCYQAKPKKKAHEREVITTAIGALIQHDASLHRWSPYAKEKWVLISSLDDFSRKLLFADFFDTETSWAQIQATESLLRRGIEISFWATTAHFAFLPEFSLPPIMKECK